MNQYPAECLGEDPRDRRWSASAYTSRHTSGYDWLDPAAPNRTRTEAPYAFTPHFLWRSKPREKLSNGMYDDRMRQWDEAAWRRACGRVSTPIRQMRQRDASVFLSAYLDRPVTATAIAEGCNVSNGYPYLIFFFDEDAS
ncbi:hypothetical protein CKO28_03055 [Rhodovibrio sodomensis]|uniref:Uncharacterized protein n=2 Tax=Rhodovibrio sodomensis TaxID=1088 RepID=A0ABS1DA73_9PROT|nr:hypothetical protein [Rhodovibrio sodomensis]